jgi:hypothetical protein
VAEFRRASDLVTVVVGYDSIADPLVLGPSTLPSGDALDLSSKYSDPMIAPTAAAQFPWTFRWSCQLAAANGGDECPSALNQYMFVNADTIVIPEDILVTVADRDTDYIFTFTVSREPLPLASLAATVQRSKSVTKTVTVPVDP